MSSDSQRRHPSVEVLLDLLEDRLAPAGRRATEEHLGRPCRACRERLRALGILIERMRSDRSEAVPSELRTRALSLFTGHVVPLAPASDPRRWLGLVFDSLTSPMTAAARHSVGEARRLRFTGDSLEIELECEPESADQFVLRGRLDAGETELHRIEVRIGEELFERWTGETGDFVFEGLPRGEVRLTVRGPSGEFAIPPFES